MAASAQPVAPSSLGMLADGFEPLEVATDTIVLVMAAPFRTSRPILLLPWLMAVLTTPCPYLFHTPAQSFSDRLALDDPVSTACFGPIVGKSQQVEAPLAPGRLVSTGRPLALNQHRLCGMHGQTEAIEPLRQDRHNPAGVCFQLASDDESSSAGESHPRALSDPDVHLAAHPAPIVQPQAVPPSANAQRGAAAVGQSARANGWLGVDGLAASGISAGPI